MLKLSLPVGHKRGRDYCLTLELPISVLVVGCGFPLAQRTTYQAIEFRSGTRDQRPTGGLNVNTTTKKAKIIDEKHVEEKGNSTQRSYYLYKLLDERLILQEEITRKQYRVTYELYEVNQQSTGYELHKIPNQYLKQISLAALDRWFGLQEWVHRLKDEILNQ